MYIENTSDFVVSTKSDDGIGLLGARISAGIAVTPRQPNYLC